MPRKLYDIDVDEITLCPSTANRKKFAIRKREENMEFIEELEVFLAEGDEEEFELSEEEIAKAEKLSDKAMKAIKGALNILNKYKDDMPADVLNAIKTLAKYAAYGYPAKKADEDDEDINKSGAKLSKTTRDQIQKVLDFLKESPKAIAMLKTLLGQKVEKIKDDEDDDKEVLSEETQAKLKKLAELEKAVEDEETKKQRSEEIKTLKEEIKKEILGEDYEEPDVEDDDEDAAAREKLKKLKKKKKEKATKKSIEGQDDDGADDDEEVDDYPSLVLPTK